MSVKEVRNVVLAVMVGMLITGGVWLAFDYAQIRVAAAQGAAAFNFIQQQISAQQGKAPTGAPVASVPETPPPAEAKEK